MTREELNKILENHQHWLNQDCEGWGNMRADLRCANLWGMILGNINLQGADLRGANFGSVCMSGANLSEAKLTDANFSHALLMDVNFDKAIINHTNFNEAELVGAKKVPYIPMVCPEEGSFIGWKKAGHYNESIVKLQIPEDARRSSATSRKCRCDKALVLGIYNLDGSDAKINEVESFYDFNFIYKVGEIVKVDNFCEDRWRECAPGIHFFINRQEAINY